MEDFDFHFFIADVIVESVQYGHREEFCNELKNYNTNDEILDWFGRWAPEHRANPEFYDSTILKKTKIEFSYNMRQWTYQYCSQLAYFQIPGKYTKPLRSANTTDKYWLDYCKRIYGKEIVPNTEAWNMRYGGKNPAVTRVIYTNGEEDPWKWASVLPGHPNKDLTPIEMKCANCAHCIDLKSDQPTDAPEVTAARAQVMEIIKGWIALEKLAMLQGVPKDQREKFVTLPVQ